MTTPQTLQSEIAGTEKAIRLLIGEQAALSSRLKRLRARLALERSRLGRPPALAAGSRFPDVSNYQSSVDWSTVHKAASIRVGALGFTKITEGTAWTDPRGATRWREMAAQGMRRGGYHFAHPTTSPSAQAQHFLKELHQQGVIVRDNDVVCLDLEVSDGASGATMRAFAKEWATEVRKAVPCKIWLYGGGPFLSSFGVTLDGFDGHWLAAYVGNPAPYMIYGKRTVAWQYTDGRYGPSPHVCPGIGACDLSVVL